MALSVPGIKAFEVIGTVESGLRWDSVNTNDPITIGVMQWYGTRAAGLLNLLQPQWGLLAASLRSSLESHAANDSYWTSRFLSAEEVNSVRPVLSSDNGKAAQMSTWETDYLMMLSKLSEFGFGESSPKPLILLMCAYHQTPARGLRIARNYGGGSDLNRIYNAIMSEPVLGEYKTRYNTARSMLESWDGVTAPTDFGSIGTIPSNGEVPPTYPSGPDSQAGNNIHSVQQNGSELHVKLADGRTIVCHPQSIQTWIPSQSVIPAPPGGPVTAPPPAGGGVSNPGGQWTHPCPARSAVSSGSKWQNPSRPDHNGVDFAGPIGTPIYSVADGTVIQAGASKGFGFAVGIRHDDGVATGYGHMDISQILVKVGDRVTKGQQIAGVNTKGQSSGPHLHFEVYGGGQWASGHIWPEKKLQDMGVTNL